MDDLGLALVEVDVAAEMCADAPDDFGPITVLVRARVRAARQMRVWGLVEAAHQFEDAALELARDASRRWPDNAILSFDYYLVLGLNMGSYISDGWLFRALALARELEHLDQRHSHGAHRSVYTHVIDRAAARSLQSELLAAFIDPWRRHHIRQSLRHFEGRLVW